MSALEHYAPLAQPDNTVINISARLLLDEFRKFAFNNRSFRAGLVDSLYIKTTEGDELEEDVVPTDEVSVGYIFDANRVRYSARPNRPELTFSLSVIAVRDAIDIPAHIAMSAYGCEDPEEAISQAGMGSLEHEKRFTITNMTRNLQVCDSYTYKDDEGHIIAYADSSPESEENESTVIEVGEGGVEIEAATIVYTSSSSDYPEAVQAESMGIDDAEEVTHIWEQMFAMEAEFGIEQQARQYDQDLLEAHRSFALFKQGLRRQLGL